MGIRTAVAAFCLVLVLVGVVVAVVIGKTDGRGTADASLSTQPQVGDAVGVSDKGGTDAAPTASVVRIERGRLIPRVVEVTGGGRVTFVNYTGVAQSLRFETPGAPTSVSELQPRETAERTFPSTGTFRYVATADGSIRGSVFVH